MGKQGHKLSVQDQTHQSCSTQPWCWPRTYFFLVSLWIQGHQFLWCASSVTCCYLSESILAVSSLNRPSRNARVSTILILNLWSLLLAWLSHLKMYTQELEIRPLVMAVLSKRQRYMTFFPGTEGTLPDMMENKNPVVWSPLTLWAQGKSVNPTTHLPQDTHLPLGCSTFTLCYQLSCHYMLHCHYSQYPGWKLVSQALSLHQQHQDSLYQPQCSTEKNSNFLPNPKAHLEKLLLV